MRKPSSFPSGHPLAGYNVVAVIDRLRVRVVLAQPTQAHVLFKQLPKQWQASFVVAVGGRPSNTDTTFEFWIQDPPGPDALEGEFNNLPGHYRPVEPVAIIAVETAIDHYPGGTVGQLDLESASIYLAKNLAKPPSNPGRVTWVEHYPSGRRRPRFMALADPRDAREALVQGATIQIGQQDSQDCARVYAKTYDSVEGESYAALPNALHRVRLERTLSGELCPFRSFDEWRTFKFDSLISRFKLRQFVKSSVVPEPLQQKRRQLCCSGLPDDAAKRRAHKRNTPRSTSADRVSYELYRAALRRLTTAQGALSGGIDPAVIGSSAAESRIANSGETGTSEGAVPEGEGGSSTQGPKYIKGTGMRPLQSQGSDLAPAVVSPVRWVGQGVPLSTWVPFGLSWGAVGSEPPPQHLTHVKLGMSISGRHCGADSVACWYQQVPVVHTEIASNRPGWSSFGQGPVGCWWGLKQRLLPPPLLASAVRAHQSGPACTKRATAEVARPTAADSRV